MFCEWWKFEFLQLVSGHMAKLTWATRNLYICELGITENETEIDTDFCRNYRIMKLIYIWTALRLNNTHAIQN